MRPIYWHQGLFIKPQHFQLHDQFISSLMEPFYRYSMPYFWGVGDLEVNIKSQTLELVKGEFVFPDNTYAVYPGNVSITARYIDYEWKEDGKPATVFLGLRKWVVKERNVTKRKSVSDLNEVDTRYVTTSDPNDPDELQKDLHQNGPDGHVKRLYYVLKFFIDPKKEILDKYEMIPIAQIEKTDEGISLVRNYVPPCLSIKSSSYLFRKINSIRDEIASRSEQLEAVKHKRGIHSGSFSHSDINYFFALTSLNRYVPILHHLTEESPVHPWYVYGILRQIVGEISSFSDTYNSLGQSENPILNVPDYDHTDLDFCFSKIETLIGLLLKQVTTGPQDRKLLEYDGTYYTASLPASVFEEGNEFYLIIRTKDNHEKVKDALRAEAKLASKKSMPTLIRQNFIAIELDPISSPPIEIPPIPNSTVFKIKHHSPEWRIIRETKVIAFHWRQPPKDIRIELIVI